ncbi:MAG: preprotein translocase subunit SecE [Cyanobacteriota bacterium]|nr:preprotein translocase subunit SecE [Cyanobacteriota bacterium]
MAKEELRKKDTKKSKEPTPKTVPPTSETQSGFNAVAFLGETQEELSKVIWPSRQQLISESATVMLMVTLVATTIYFVDNLFSWLARTVF